MSMSRPCEVEEIERITIRKVLLQFPVSYQYLKQRNCELTRDR